MVGESGGFATSLSVVGSSSLSLPTASYFSGPALPRPDVGPGLLGSYYNMIGHRRGFTADQRQLQHAAVSPRLDSNITLDNPTTQPTGIFTLNLAVQWTGYINILNGGLYAFTTSSDDCSQIYIPYGILMAKQ